MVYVEYMITSIVTVVLWEFMALAIFFGLKEILEDNKDHTVLEAMSLGAVAALVAVTIFFF